MSTRISRFLVVFLLALAWRASAAVSDAELTRNVQKQISGLDYGMRRPVVTVADGVVTVSGTVGSLWLKQETINRALKVTGVASVVSDLTIAKAENDDKVAEGVVDRIQHYDLFTVFDDFQGRVKNGVVYLAGAVTEEKKHSDIIERVSKVRGVQAIDDKVVVLPANQSDDRIRVAIADAMYGLPEFERYSRANPPVHIIVNNGHVTLTGLLRSDIEKRKAHEAAQFINGVLALDDRIQLARNTR